MTTDAEFVSQALDLFAPPGSVRTGRLSGGKSHCQDDGIFAVVFAECLFMNADPPPAARYTAVGAEPFKNNKAKSIKECA